MTQRIFDTDNEQDMQDLWDILPDDIVRICPMINRAISYLEYKDDEGKTDLFKINWHDKTEITRPIQEATEQDVGKICVFWDNGERRVYGLLSDLIFEESEDRKYGCVYGRRWTHARRLTKQEIEELC